MNRELQKFFYEKASNRINKKIKEKDLSFFKIYPENPNIISWIVSGTITHRNPFLITDTAVLKLSESLYGYELSDKDRAYSYRSLYWGNNKEIEEYIYKLMELISKSLTPEQQLVFDNTLMDDIYFAETVAYQEILNENNSMFIGMDMDELYSFHIPVSRISAEEELLKNIKDKFLEEFIKFLDNGKYVRTKVNGNHKCVKKGITFKNQFNVDEIVEVFLKVVCNYKLPIEESMGIRVYSIVKKDIAKLDSLIEEEVLYDIVYAPYRKNELWEAELEFQRTIIETGQNYIKSLYDAHRNRNEIWGTLENEKM